MAASAGRADFAVQAKILLLGDSATGKTSLLNRYSDDKFSSSFIATVGVDYKSKIESISAADGSKTKVKLQIWDTAGQERFRTISLSFLRGAHGIALVFAITDRRSFEHVRDWMAQVKEQTEGVPMVLIANKADMEDSREVAAEEAKAAAASLGLEIFFASAKTGENVREAFLRLGQMASEKALAARAAAGHPTAAGGAGGAPVASAAASGSVDLKATPAAGAGGANGCSC